MNQLQDTMIATKEFEKAVKFYLGWARFEVVQKNEDFALLRNPETHQTLCLTNGPSVSQTAPGFRTDDLAKSMEMLTKLGGKIRKTWEFGSMKGANCEDPEGNELMLWQGDH